MVRQATEHDYSAIKAIKEKLALEVSNLTDLAYKLHVQQQGFLLKSPYTEEDMKTDLQKVYVVYEHEGKVVGYLRIDEEQEMRKEADALWFRPELKDVFFAKPHADIGGIAVLPGDEQKGFASQMLAHVEKELQAKGISYVFSFIVLSPVVNFPSMMFHEKNGFERLALVPAPELFVMKNFQSFLYGKKLS